MLRQLMIAAALVTTTACGPSFTARTPPGFVELKVSKYSAYDYRATTADGLVIAAREIEHEPRGDMAFWVKAIKNRMRDRGGYALLEEVDVVSADGAKGHQMRFGHDENGKTPYLYWLTLFITEDRLLLVEAGGTKEQMTAQQAAVDAAVHGFRAN